MEQKLSEQELVRRQKMEELRAKGIDPFGHAFARTHRSAQLRSARRIWKRKKSHVRLLAAS